MFNYTSNQGNSCGKLAPGYSFFIMSGFKLFHD